MTINKGNGGSLDDIINPHTGKPIKPQPKIIVVKAPPEVNISGNLMGALTKTTGCIVVRLPMDAELLTGRVAKEYIEAIHMSIHQALGIPPAN
jgi:hypothetical protein